MINCLASRRAPAGTDTYNKIQTVARCARLRYTKYIVSQWSISTWPYEHTFSDSHIQYTNSVARSDPSIHVHVWDYVRFLDISTCRKQFTPYHTFKIVTHYLPSTLTETIKRIGKSSMKLFLTKLAENRIFLEIVYGGIDALFSTWGNSYIRWPRGGYFNNDHTYKHISIV